MKLSRRTFFKVNAVGVAALAVTPGRANAATARTMNPDAMGMLVDTTLCVGCRGCESACAEANANPEPSSEDTIFDTRRETSPEAFTVVNRLSADPERYGKTQCMHCLEPACASACPARALEKTPGGAVTYTGSRCLGCRYCMMACPFDVPKFEYAKAVPYIKKCTFCAERQAKGQPPACAEICPSGALTFGRRADLLEEARTRIYQNPDKYVHHIYGEHEAGGTSWLYLTDLPIEKLGLPTDLRQSPYPELTSTALGAVPIVMTLWPPLLMGLYTFFGRGRNEQLLGEPEDHHE
jgi:Fe-S-cluster-containing dehydrogenase component